MTEKNLSKIMGLAINDYTMIRPGDRILVAVSGGTDSIALVNLLAYRLQRIPPEAKYELVPLLIDHLSGEDEEHNRQIENVRKFIQIETGLELKILRKPVIQYLTANREKIKDRNICFKCAQIRRTELIKKAVENKCNKIALGHHKDDIVETILMNLVYRREASAMLPRLELFEGKLELIRPLAYVEKKKISAYVRDKEAPLLEEGCPLKVLNQNQLRDEVREMTDFLSAKVPDFKNNLFAAFRNPKNDYFLNHDFNPHSSGVFRRP